MHNKTVLLVKMHDTQNKLGVENMSSFVIKEIKGIFTEEQTRKYNRNEK